MKTDAFDAFVNAPTSKIKCEACGRGIPTPIYRTSPKGGPFRGRCWGCLTPEQKASVDPEVKRINEILDGVKLK